MHKSRGAVVGYRGVVLDTSSPCGPAPPSRQTSGSRPPPSSRTPRRSCAVRSCSIPRRQRAEDRGTSATSRLLARGPIALSAGSVGTSYRGGRVARSRSSSTGSASEQLDASSGGLASRRISWAKPRSSPMANPSGMARPFRAPQRRDSAIPTSPGRAGSRTETDRPAGARSIADWTGSRRAPAGPSRRSAWWPRWTSPAHGRRR